MLFSLTQEEQEKQYLLPYHWFINPNTYRGREYFGYLNLIFNLFFKTKNIKILDAGCGDGLVLSKLFQYGYKKLFGVDYSNRAISLAKLLLSDKINLQVANLKNLDYPSNFFDIILLIETLEHIKPDEVTLVINELYRILKPAGKLIISVPSDNLLLIKKHYQHFNEKKISNILNSKFKILDILGQNRVKFHPFLFIYKFFDNRYWLIKPLATYYNIKIWPKLFNSSKIKSAGRLIIEAQK